jgi:RHS repeat-associated protein
MAMAFGQQIRVWTVWYINVSNCTSAGTGTMTPSSGPQYGTVSSVVGSLPLPPGYACAGVSLPETTAYYTWTVSTPTALVDYFHLHWQASNGASADTDWEGMLNGAAPDHPGSVAAGDPIDLGTGNVFRQTTDYTTAGQNPLSFVRYYNSLGVPNTYAAELGVNWRSNYDRFLSFISPSLTVAERPDGALLSFTLTGGVWTPDSDVDFTLTQSGSTWTLTDHNDTVETYSTPVQGLTYKGVAVNSIRARNGYTQTLEYSLSQLQSVTDSYGRQVLFTYNGASVSTVSTPDDLTLTFGYNTIVGGVNNQLTSISYSTSPVTIQKYSYANTKLPFALTSITDENGNTYATYTYDQFGRGLTSQLGIGAYLTTVAYVDTNTISRMMTNALGQPEIYTFGVLQTVPKNQSIQREATTTTAAATYTFTYDSNGYTASATDWNGNLTTYVNDSHGDPTTINEAVGTPVARTTTIVYDPTCVHLPHSVTTVGLTTTFTYDSSCDVLTRTDTDTTTQTAPYSTNGQTRAWTYTWSTFLMASARTPNGNVTKYSYSASGALTEVLNPLKQATNITSYTGGGYPITTVDPNNVATTLTYSPRLWLLTSTVSAAGQPSYTTTRTYDPAGNLTKVTLPDNSFSAYTYDTAHRVTQVADALGNYVKYTLDGLGDKTQINTYSSTNTLTRQHSDTFDALGRMLTDVGGVGQTTTFTYDNNGNKLNIVDALLNKTTQVIDALNRISTSTDPNLGLTQFTYDPHNRTLTVTDPNSNITAYVYDGFGDTIQQTSPDSGKTVHRYDKDANLLKKTDARGIVANNTYDKLDRVLTTTYPADAAENVGFTYDQTGATFAFGIGRLTSLTDQAGSLTRSWDERGNMLSEQRVGGGTTLMTTYTYDPASRIAGIAYPDGALVTNVYNSAGYLAQVSAQPVGAGTSSTIATLTHLPFGPINSAAFGNGVAEAWMFDPDYRATNLTDTVSATTLQGLTYGYDADNNVKAITDAVNATNTQTLGYDVLNRLTGATSGSGGYGSYGWTYDPVGNRLTQTANGVRTSYGYAPGTNRLSRITTKGVSTPVKTSGNGNIASIPPANSNAPATFAYNNANRLASVTGSPLAANYVYDAFGRRFSKTNPGSPSTVYTYAQNTSLLEENDNGAITDYVYADGRPIAVLEPGVKPTSNQVNFILADHLGTPQLASNSSVSTVWSAAYQPFGTTTTPAGAITQNVRFPGQHFDGETGFSYNVNRDYMPNLGRYLESDPIGLRGGMNPYSYARANPMKFTDRLGLDEQGYDAGNQGYDATIDSLNQAYGPEMSLPSSSLPINNPHPESNPIYINPPSPTELDVTGYVLDAGSALSQLSGNELFALILDRAATACHAAADIESISISSGSN